MKAQILYLLWHCPDPSSYHPVGRLIRRTTDDGDCFEFVYLKGAAFVGLKRGFQPIAGGFPDPSKRYESRQLFPFFANRMMDKKRLDYADYIESLGLPSDAADDLVTLSRGVANATDAFETFGYPRFNEVAGTIEYYFWLRGIRYHGPQADAASQALRAGQVLRAMPQPENPVDRHAIGLFGPSDGPQLGFLANILTREFETLRDASANPQIIVDRVNPPPTAIQQRVLCNMRASWNESFIPFSHEAMQPLVSGAWDITEDMDVRTREWREPTSV